MKNVANQRIPAMRLRRWKRRIRSLPSLTIKDKGVPEAVREYVDDIFDSLGIAGYKLLDKREFVAQAIYAGIKAYHKGGTVRFSRSWDQPNAKLKLQSMDALVAAGIFDELRALPGFSEQMTRLLLTVEAMVPFQDPRTLGTEECELVRLTKRRKKGEKRVSIPVDPGDAVAKKTRRVLDRVNRVNGKVTITYEPFMEFEEKKKERRQLRPVHFARFTDDLEHHGRLYTGRHGHQSLRKEERATIQYDGQPTVELDFAGLHIRMAYHLAGIEFTSDPYALWGKRTTPAQREMAKAQREMAKALVNALLNASSTQAAVSACNRKMNPRNPPTKAQLLRHKKNPRRDPATGKVVPPRGSWKTGKRAETAERLRHAAARSGLSFSDIVPLVLKKHHRVRDCFGSDMGMALLMRLDSKIALDVMEHFAKNKLPILGNHDSFIVPAACEPMLKEAMKRAYRNHVGFEPVVG